VENPKLGQGSGDGLGRDAHKGIDGRQLSNVGVGIFYWHLVAFTGLRPLCAPGSTERFEKDRHPMEYHLDPCWAWFRCLYLVSMGE
jgi:hypothetical protein